MNAHSRVLLNLSAIFLLGAAIAAAQSVSTSQIKGTVQDSSGLAVPGAEVKVTQLSTGATRVISSSGDGAYLFPNLAVGPYQLKSPGKASPNTCSPASYCRWTPTPRSTSPSRSARSRNRCSSKRPRRWSKPTAPASAGGRLAAHRRSPLERPPGNRPHLSRRRRHHWPRGRSQLQQELPDAGNLSRGRSVEWHDLPARRRHPQRPIQQSEPAHPLPRRPAGVQGRNQCAARPVRPPRLRRGQRGHKIRRQRFSRRHFRIRAQRRL